MTEQRATYDTGDARPYEFKPNDSDEWLPTTEADARRILASSFVNGQMLLADLATRDVRTPFGWLRAAPMAGNV